MRIIRQRTLHSLFAVVLCSALAFAAETITGTVRNQTAGQPSIGDQVVLLRLEYGMEEEARTFTDSQGRFALPASAAGAQHVVRVMHDGLNYDQPVTTGAELEINVYDSVAKVPGLYGSLGIAQVESDGNFLKITEMYSISNVSSPPVTQEGAHNFDFSLPPAAVLNFLMVKRPGGIWVNVVPTPRPDFKDSYSVDFPLQPGDTLFKFVYRLPEKDAMPLRLKLPYPIRNFAIMHPPSMRFRAVNAATFSSSGIVQGLQVERSTGTLQVEVPAFEVSGVGVVPPEVVAREVHPVQSASAPQSRVSAQPGAVAPIGQASSAGILALGSAFLFLLGAIAFGLWQKKRNGMQAPEAAAGPASIKGSGELRSSEELLDHET
jgi:hypothetical protein